MRITSEGEKKGSGCLVRTLVTLLVMAVIVYGALFAALRTNGGKSAVEKWLSGKAGMAVSAESTKLGFPFALVVEGVKFGEDTGISAGRISLSPGPGMRLRLELDSACIIISRDGDGAWSPAVLGFLGDVPLGDISDFAVLMAPWRKKLAFAVSKLDIRWLGANAEDLAMAEGVEFKMHPIKVPGRDAYYQSLSAYKYVVPGIDRSMVSGMAREWLSVGDMDYMEIGRAGDSSGAAGEFWEVSE